MYRSTAALLRPTWIDLYGSGYKRRSRSGSHWILTGTRSFSLTQSSLLIEGSGWLGQLCSSAHPKPSRLTSIAKIRRWPSFLYPHPARYIIHRNDGLIQVIRAILKGGDTKVPRATAASAISLL